MDFNVNMFPKNYLYRLFCDMIENNNLNTFDKISDELINNCQITLSSYDDLCVISIPSLSPSLKHMNKLVDNVIHNVKVCVINKHTLLPIIYMNKTQNYFDGNPIFNIIHTYDYLKHKDTIKIYKHYIGLSVVMFHHENNWLLLIKNKLHKLDSCDFITSIFKKTLVTKVDVEQLNTNVVYEFTFFHYRLNKPVIYSNWGENYEEILYIKSTEKYTLNPFLSDIPNNFIKNTRLYFSCFDEMNAYLGDLHKNNIHNKKITARGLLFTYSIDNNTYKVALNTGIYDEISTYFDKNQNIHRTHLYIYQKDKCNEVLTYVTYNCHQIIRRINISLKTLSKEILNIYFLTRNKQNIDLYNILPKCYRYCLFNIHKIFMTKREEDILNKDFDGIIEKRSVTVDNVYGFLKNIQHDMLIEIYMVRIDLLNEIKKLSLKNTEIMYDTCINTMLQTKLMTD